MFWVYDVATMTILYMKVLYDKVHKNLKLLFQKPPSSPRNVCTEHWRKLPSLAAFLEIFLCLKNNDFVEHM